MLLKFHLLNFLVERIPPMHSYNTFHCIKLQNVAVTQWKGENFAHSILPFVKPQKKTDLMLREVVNCWNIFKSSSRTSFYNCPPTHTEKSIVWQQSTCNNKGNLISWISTFSTARLDQFDIEILNFPTHLTNSYSASRSLLSV